MNELTQRGIAALKAGERTTARKLLASAVQQDANDITAWLWLAGALDGDDERIACLQQVLRIDPGNQAAARGLAQILERRTRPASMAAAAPTAAAPTPLAQTPPPAQPPAAQTPAAKPVTPDPVEPPAPSTPATTTSYAPPALSTPVTTPPYEPPAPSEPAITTVPEPPAPDAWRGLTWDTAPADTSAVEAAHAGPPVSAVFVEDQTADEAARQAQIDAAPAEAAAPAAEAVDMDALAAFSAPAGAAAPETAAGVPFQRKHSKESYLPMRRIFTTRPSMVPALLCFWLFFFGAVITGNLLAKNEPMMTQIAIVPQALMENPVKVQASSAFALAMGLILELVVLYATLRIFTIRYELTNQTLTLRFRGKRARVPVEYIYNAECKQSFIQTMIGTGHLDLDLAVNGELAHVRLRDIPECKKRRDQIMYLVQDLS